MNLRNVVFVSIVLTFLKVNYISSQLQCFGGSTKSIPNCKHVPFLGPGEALRHFLCLFFQVKVTMVDGIYSLVLHSNFKCSCQRGKAMNIKKQLRWVVLVHTETYWPNGGRQRLIMYTQSASLSKKMKWNSATNYHYQISTFTNCTWLVWWNAVSAPLRVNFGKVEPGTLALSSYCFDKPLSVWRVHSRHLWPKTMMGIPRKWLW